MGHLTRLLMAATALATTVVPAHADPLSIGVSILVNIGYGGAISAFGATLLGSAVLAAGFIGLQFASNALNPQRPAEQTAPTARQATLRQSVGPRLRFYGRVKVGGTMFFFESKTGVLYVGVMFNEGQILDVEELWMNDSRVYQNDFGYVVSAPYPPGIVLVEYKYGLSNQTVQGTLLANFPGIVTEAHRLRGVANFLASFTEVAKEDIPTVYPQGNPNIRIVIRASIVLLVRYNNYAWSENPADIAYDYLTRRDDAGFPYGPGFDPDDIDLASFQAFADLSDEPITNKDGQLQKRYVCWGGYAMNEQMRDVMPRILASADAELYLTSHGKIAIRGGQWVDPVLTLDSGAGHILSGEFRQGRGKLAAFNELNIIYTDPGQDYKETEAERWLDTANISLRGQVLSEQLRLEMVPFHAQARRLGKIYTHKQNPRWVGTISTNYYGFNAMNEPTVRVIFAPLQIDETFRITGLRVRDDFTGVDLQIASLSSEAYEWDAFLEEGTGPSQPPDTSTDVDLPPPEDIVVTPTERVVEGSLLGVYLVVTWTPPSRPALQHEVQYRTTVGPGGWINMNVSQENDFAESGLLDSGEDYDVQVRTLSPGGGFGPWSDPVTVTATP